MISVYGKIQKNEKEELCVHEIAVADLLEHFDGKEVAITISELEEEEK
ncbi:hypothetical protein [Halalkalibacter wakoensis]|nr:hypothetical protein [Halalkalibacter wakoensis]